MKTNKTKIAVGVLGVSAALISGIAAHEGYSSKPYRDSVGVPTIGHGTTVYENGRRVKMTDKPVDRKRALELLKAHVGKDEAKIKAMLPGVKLSQAEYDVFLDFAYQYGTEAFRKSSIRRELLKGNYGLACRNLLKYKYAGGRDCSIRRNNCYGVWARQLDRYGKCMAANVN